jgi:hypothetical protein
MTDDVMIALSDDFLQTICVTQAGGDRQPSEETKQRTEHEE